MPTVRPDEPRALLEGVALSYSYNATPVLRDFSVRALPGESLAVIGAPGSGTTTLLRCLAGRLTPTAGAVRLLGRDLTLMSDEERERSVGALIGWVGGSPGSLNMSVERFVAEPLLSMGTPVVAAFEWAREALQPLGLRALSETRLDGLDACDLRLVEIARATITSPAVLLMDDPTRGLTLAGALRVLEVLAECAARPGRAVVIASTLPELGAWADRAVDLPSLSSTVPGELAAAPSAVAS
jgi:putative ABC transport system ATP-binding protein